MGEAYRLSRVDVCDRDPLMREIADTLPREDRTRASHLPRLNVLLGG
jgi:hypothetical protein